MGVGANGWLSFTSADPWFPSNVPAEDEFAGAIAPFASDLFPPNANYIRYQTFGSAPNRRFVVEYNNIPDCCEFDNPKTFEVIFYERTNRIRFQYLTVPNDPVAIGIESPDQTTGMGNVGVDDLFLSPALVEDNYAIEFSRQPTWINVEPASGTVPPGDSTNVAVTFDAMGLVGGDYDANIVISSNDPDEAEVVVPAHLQVTGAPDILVKVDSIDFGVRFVNFGGEFQLVIQNIGVEVLEISEISVDNPVFSVAPTMLTIPARAWESVTVSFLPTTPGSFTGTLSIVSNDPDEGSVQIALLSEAIEAPIINVTPDSLSADLFVNDSTQQVLTLSNSGGSDLIYNIFVVERNPAGTLRTSPPPGTFNNRIRLNSLKNLWQQLRKNFNPEQMSSQGGGAPAKRHANTQNSTQFFQLLHTDPDEPELTFDIQFVFGAVTSNELLFKLESYVAWSDPEGNGIAFIGIDADRDTSTGLNSEEFEFGWFLGIDYAIFRTGDPFDVGFYQWNEGFEEFEKIDDLTTNIVEPNSNVTLVGVRREHFGPFPIINLAVQAGSFNDPDLDYVPDLGTGHITFTLMPPWIRLRPTEGVIPAGGQQDITVTFDATDLLGGDYDALIVIDSNDPANPEAQVTAHLSVTGVPAIFVPVDTVDFGISFVSHVDSTLLEIQNVGSDVLEIDNVVVGDARVTVSPASLIIPPLQSDSLKLFLLADEVGDFNTTLSFTTNDPNLSEVTLTVKSTILIAPDIALSPAELQFEVPQGEMASDSVMISNTGGSPLEFSTHITYQSRGKTLSLDGFGDGVTVSDHPALDLRTSLTMEMWIYPRAITQDFPRLLAKGQSRTSFGNYGVYELALNGTVGQENAGPAFATIVDAATAEPFFVFSFIEIPFNTWTHLAATYDGNSFRLYVNGELHDEIFISVNILTNDHILSIGKWPFGNYNSFRGEIDEVRVWNRALTQEKIQEHMFAPLSGAEPGLVGYWRFDADLSDGSQFGHPSSRVGNATLVTSTLPVTLDFLTLSPVVVTVSENETRPLLVTINSSFLATEMFNATIFVVSNDPDETQVALPVKVKMSTPVSVEKLPDLIPKVFALEQNYPNPFNPETRIKYQLPQTSQVTIKIYNILGEEVKTLVDKEQKAGYHKVNWNGTNNQGEKVASGVYVYRLQANPNNGQDSFVVSKKMILLK